MSTQPPADQTGGPGGPQDGDGSPPPPFFAPLADAPAPPPPSYGGYTPQEKPKGRLLSMAAMVVGLFGLITFCFPIFAIPSALVAIVLGVVAVVRVRRGSAGGGRMAWAGLILGIVGLVAAIVMIIAAGRFIESNKDCLKLPTQSEQQQCLQDRIGR